MKAKRGKKNQSLENELLNADRRALWQTIAWGLLIVALCAGLLAFFYKAGNRVNPREYEGRIVDRWVGYSHSDQGSFPYFRLVVETDDNHKMTVAVDRDNYERSRVGMRIRKTSTGIELSLAEPAKNQLQYKSGS